MFKANFFTELKRRNVYRTAALYVTASITLVQTADIAVPVFSLDDSIVQYVFAALFALFIPVLAFSWAFEITPSGIKRDDEVSVDERRKIHGSWRTERVVIALLVVVVLLLAIDRIVSFRQQTALDSTSADGVAAQELDSIAVLAFRNMSPDPDNDYFCEGLSDTILNYLAQIPSLKVAARTSSFVFKGAATDIRQIAEDLGVATVLEGSVQKSGERLRITAQLIRAADGFHLWSRSYDRPLGDVFAIQDEISTDIAQVLDGSLDLDSLSGAVATRNAVAFDLYLRGLSLQSDIDPARLEAARGFFEQALREDPSFVEARIGLSRNFMLQVIADEHISAEAIAASIENANSVLEVRPNENEAHELVLISNLLRLDQGVTPRGESIDPSSILNSLGSTNSNADAKALLAERFALRGYDTESKRLVSDLLANDPLNEQLLSTRALLREDARTLK